MLKALVASFLLLLSSHAGAQSFFFGGSLGQSDFQDHAETVSLIDPGSSLDGKDTALKLFAGYQITRHFGVEAAYVDLGKASYSGTTFGLPVTGGSVEVWGFNIAALGTFPLNERFTVLGKAGLFLSQTEFAETVDGTPLSDEYRSWHPSLGIGAAYRFGRSVALRVEWEYFKLDPKNAGLLSFGVQYSF